LIILLTIFFLINILKWENILHTFVNKNIESFKPFEISGVYG
jgi:hypothetical protein